MIQLAFEPDRRLMVDVTKGLEEVRRFFRDRELQQAGLYTAP
jgi:hypothetical protein